ncbi:MAG TPA: ATP-binding protein [Candidatus Binataceae bacterium]|nr:ATP-binding protein [Candidatus Binataceae bacterium]
MTETAAAYPASLRNYLGGAGESALQQAYQIGRGALDAGIGLVAIAEVHHTCLRELLAHDMTGDERDRIVTGAAQFFAECISPYEMTYGGFREANTALRHFNEVLEQEAKRIANALHDEAGQLLVAIYIELQKLSSDVPAAQAHVLKATQLLDQIEIQLRRLSHELVPALLNDLGLVPALRYLFEGLAQRSRLRINIDAVPEQRLPRRIETTLYHVAKEALHNVIKHARATEVWIRFRRDADLIGCSIRDDGVGFDPTSIAVRPGERGFGVIGMRERLGVVGGDLQINSADGRGTELVIVIPLEN